MSVISARDVLSELVTLCECSVKARALFREFLDHDAVLATLKVDPLATARAGHTVFDDEPSEGLLRCLAAAKALNGD